MDQKKNVFKYTISLLEIQSTAVFDQYGILDVNKIKNPIEEIMCDSLKINCLLKFYGGMRENVQDNVLYANCGDAEHCIRYKFCLDNDAKKPVTLNR